MSDDRDNTSERVCCAIGRGAVLAWSLIAAAALIGSSLLLVWREWGVWWGVLIALAPLVPFIGMFIALRRWLDGLDEMQRQIQLQALALCVLLASVVCVAGGQLQKLGVLGELDLSMGWVVIVGSYIVSYLLVRTRY